MPIIRTIICLVNGGHFQLQSVELAAERRPSQLARDLSAVTVLGAINQSKSSADRLDERPATGELHSRPTIKQTPPRPAARGAIWRGLRVPAVARVLDV